jgi:uncharacterized protein
MKKFAFALFTLCMVALVACKKEEQENEDTFDREALLRNYAQAVVRPAFDTLLTHYTQLHNSLTQLADMPSAARVEDSRLLWKKTYTTWMWANSFNFGPAGENGINKSLVEEIGTWPANVTLIENNIATGNIGLNDFNRDSRGLNAIEYLLFATADAAQTAQRLLDNPLRGAYLTAIGQRALTQITAVSVAWNNNYSSEFVNNNGTDVGSSTSMMYNEYVKSFEALKNFKVALPLGLRAGQTQAEPALVEARYSGASLQMVNEHYFALKHVWYGKDRYGADGIGWRDYLKSVEGGAALIASTESQFARIEQAFEAIATESSLETQINTNINPLIDLHTALQQHTRFFKSDMSSLLGITITFSSGDGD